MPVRMDDVAAMAMALPEVTEGERFRHRTWIVNGKGFAWERPLSKADIKRYGTETPPDGPIIAVAVEDLGAKEAVLAEEMPGFFTIQHFNGYPAILIQLKLATKRDVCEAILDAWLTHAPQALADQHMASARQRKR